MKTLMRYNPGMYNVSSLTDSYYRFFEVALGYWLTEGNRSYSNYNYVTYGKLLGGAVDTTDPLQELNFQGIYVNTSFYISAQLSIHPPTHPSIRPFIHPSIHPVIYLSIHPSVRLSVRLLIRPSIQTYIHT